RTSCAACLTPSTRTWPAPGTWWPATATRCSTRRSSSSWSATGTSEATRAYVGAMSDVLLSRDGHVATITLNRPDRLNAISGDMLVELGRMLVECDQDRDVRVVVLTGAGRGFCSGLDLQDVSAGTGIGAGGGTGGLSAGVVDTPPFVFRRIDVPVLCALNGP